MSESPTGVATDLVVAVQTEPEISQVKKELFNPHTISKKNNQEGRDKLAAELREKRRERDALHQDMATTQTELDDRQSSLLVKLKTKLKIPDKQTQELEAKKLEQNEKDENLPDTRKMVEAYYEKVAETPLTNQEKRDLLKPEVLSQLSMDEYVALWKRLNPYFLTHVTRQGFRDHAGQDIMVMHNSGTDRLVNGFVEMMENGRAIFPPFAARGLTETDDVSTKIYLSHGILQFENKEKALEQFHGLLDEGKAAAPPYPDFTATHLAAQIVSDYRYGGETGNEVFFVFPSDTVASQYDYAFNGWYKEFTKPQNEEKWNDVFVWPDKAKNLGLPIDAGFTFLPEKAMVDPETGSQYASEVIVQNGEPIRVMIEDVELRNRFVDWSMNLNEDSNVIALAREYETDDYYLRDTQARRLNDTIYAELETLGFDRGRIDLLIDSIVNDVILWRSERNRSRIEEMIDLSRAKYKRPEKTITSKEYWENYFIEHPELRPKHIVYYDDEPTGAIYSFLRINHIGGADTSKTDGNLLGFDDRHVADMSKDPRANKGYRELRALGEKIIEEHYRDKI